jgi:hypothetical protein
MDTYVIYELIGYAASLLVAISLMMSAIVKLRVVNMIGAFTFSVYGILIGSIPVAAMNGFIVLINIYYLIKIYRDESFFDLLKLSEESTYLEKFLDFYRDHIRTYQPSFSFSDSYNYALFVLSDMVPAGLILGNREGNELRVALDFVVPSHRDFKIGKFLFRDHSGHFREEGIDMIRTEPGNDDHNQYLEKMGFRKSGSDYLLNLK